MLYTIKYYFEIVGAWHHGLDILCMNYSKKCSPNIIAESIIFEASFLCSSLVSKEDY